MNIETAVGRVTALLAVAAMAAIATGCGGRDRNQSAAQPVATNVGAEQANRQARFLPEETPLAPPRAPVRRHRR